MFYLLQTILSDSAATTTEAVGSSWFEWKVTVGDVLTFLGIAIAVFEYWKNSKKSRKQAISNQKETWFLHVIVLPQLDGINKFYQELITDIKADQEAISDYKKECFDQCNLHVAELKKQRKDEINNFFDHIVALVMSYNETLGREVNDIVMALEDVYVMVIDGYVNSDEIDNIRGQFLQNKQQLIAKLNSGLKK